LYCAGGAQQTPTGGFEDGAETLRPGGFGVRPNEQFLWFERKRKSQKRAPGIYRRIARHYEFR